MQRFFIIIERTNVLIGLANPDRMWYSYIEHIFDIKGRQWRTDMELAERGMELKEKLRILADAAKYDVACTSSGVDRRGKKEIWEIQQRRGFVTALQRTADVSPC